MTYRSACAEQFSPGETVSLDAEASRSGSRKQTGHRGIGGGSLPHPRVTRPAIPRAVFPVENRPYLEDSDPDLKLPGPQVLTKTETPT
jgi:hypothetical protein